MLPSRVAEAIASISDFCFVKLIIQPGAFN